MFKNKRWIRALLIGVSLLFTGLFIAPAQMNATTPEANPDEVDQNRTRLQDSPPELLRSSVPEQ